MDPSYLSDHSQQHPHQPQQHQQQPQTHAMHNLVGLGGGVPSLSNPQGMSQSSGPSGLGGGGILGPSSTNNTNNNALPAHLMGLMTNPALAAAAAASPLFPPAALLSNPGAYLSMPEAFAAGVFQARQQGLQQGLVHDVSPPAPPNLGGMLSSLSMAQTQQQQAVQQMTTTSAANGMNNPFLGMQPLQATSIAIPSQPPTSVTATSVEDRKASRNKASAVASNHELSAEDRQKQNRDRNREHARSTRLRKKAYVAKLKELVEGLHAERTEEVRQRRIAIQSLAEMQNVRRTVVKSFLRYHAHYETDERKWNTLLEDKFWLKQPVTPYRSFRSSEIEKAYHISRGLPSLLCDAASLSVMIESIGSRSPRWMQRKRQEFLHLEEAKRGSKKMPACIVRQESRLQHAISSLSSSSGSSNQGGGSSGEEGHQARFRHAPHLGSILGGRSNTPSHDGSHLHHPPHHHHHHHHHHAGDGTTGNPGNSSTNNTNKVSSSSGSSNDSRGKHDASNDFHDYHAKPLPDPEPVDSDRSSASADDSPADESNSSSSMVEDETKRISTDSSSGDDSAGAADGNNAETRAHKRRKVVNGSGTRLSAGEAAMLASATGTSSQRAFPATIAKKGGIPHNIKPVAKDPPLNGAARLRLAPAVPLRPFLGIGKSGSSSRSRDSETPSLRIANGISTVAEIESSSEDSSTAKVPQIRASYHINEDDMILMDDILMCPFTFRTQDAVVCGALAECVMPGMLRAHFSERNKLQSLELVYDAMGFMQQLERASGREGAAQIIPSTLEMALSPSSSDARVITMAKPPFQIVNVNDVWTQITGYTQVEVEGEPYLSLLEGDGSVPHANDRVGKPKYDLEEIAKGRSACTTNIHYDKSGNDFVEYVCSYPLTNSNGEVTHLLHVSNELPSFHGAMMEQ